MIKRGKQESHHDGELKAKLLVGILTLLLRRPRCLSSKLVAGKSYQVKAVRMILFIELAQTGIVDILQRSGAGNVHHDSDIAAEACQCGVFLVLQDRKVVGSCLGPSYRPCSGNCDLKPNNSVRVYFDGPRSQFPKDYSQAQTQQVE